MTKHANKKQPKQAAPVEIAQVPGFFGHEVQPGQALQWANEVEEFVLNVNSAALGAQVAEGRSTLFVKVKGAKVALCTLAPQSAEQWNLTQTFAPLDGEVEFLVEGVNPIHLTGFIDVQDEEDSGDEHDFDDDDHALDAEGEEVDSDDMMVFGAAGSSDEETESEGDEEEEQDAEDRFEVLEERVHVHKDEAAPAKKADAKKPEVKKADAKKAEVKKAEVKKAEVKKETAKSPAKEQPKKQEQKVAAKEKAAAEAAKAKKQAEKIAELTASAGKKRPAPSDAVDVPKKAKTSRPYKGITIEEQAVGKGKGVQKGKKVSILYRGRLENGKQFDAAQNRKKPFTFRHGIGDVIKGMDIGLEGMRAGGKRTIHIPAKLGYGRSGAPPTIPPNANLIFDIELL